jgi:hypothetical protein
MPFFTITTAAAVTALWTTLEVVSIALRDKALKGTFEPVTDGIADWLQEKSGWKDKKRQKVFFDAYRKAESMLVNQIGLVDAYRIFRMIPQLTDSEQREELIMKLLASDKSSSQLEISGVNYEDRQYLKLFTEHLRKCLWQTEFRPLIQFYNTEEARAIRSEVLQQLETISQVVDAEHRAVRVMMVAQSPNYEEKRRTYLEQMGAFFEEQDFKGFPKLREQRMKPLLREVYVPLKIRYESGGEQLSDVLGGTVDSQRNELEEPNG